MNNIQIAAAQFEIKNGDKEYNLAKICELTAQAVEKGAEVVSFHECCISAYSFVQQLSKEQLMELAEPVPNGKSIQRLMEISREFHVPLLAGFIERDGNRLYNTYFCVDGNELVANYRKLHAFINPHIASGDEYCLFNLRGWKCGILICYDNNIIENVRMTTLLGADIIFMPHVTGCLPSVMPGRGLVDPKLWANREADPVALRMELDGPKGRGWLMHWLPARAYDNGIYAVFTNPIGIDNGEVRNGNAMVLDPYGEVISECRNLGDDVCVGLCTPEKIESSSGRRFIRARRTGLYGKLTESTGIAPVTTPGWELQSPKDV